jgi:hypothetical protein
LIRLGDSAIPVDLRPGFWRPRSGSAGGRAAAIRWLAWPHPAKIHYGPVRGRCFRWTSARSCQARVVDLVRVLGQACNDASLAVLDAQTQLAHAAEAFWRSCERVDRPEDLMNWVAVEHYFACRDHVERLTAMYARASAQYAVCAVETASRVANGQPPTVPTPMSAPPARVGRAVGLCSAGPVRSTT